MKGASPFGELSNKPSMSIVEHFVGSKNVPIELSDSNPYYSMKSNSIYVPLSELPSHLPHLSVMKWPINLDAVKENEVIGQVLEMEGASFSYGSKVDND